MLAYNQGAAIDLAPGDLTEGEIQFFDGYFGLDEAAGTNLVLAGGTAGFSAESTLPYSALPTEFVSATGLDPAGSVKLAGTVAFGSSGLETFELNAELSGLPGIDMPDALFDTDPTTPTSLSIEADLTDEGSFAFGIETGLLLIDGADSIPVLLQAGFEDGAVAFSAETTGRWVTPFDQAWMGTLDTVSFAIEAGAGGELSVTMQTDLVLGADGVLALEFTAETDGSVGSFEFAATADGITEDHIRTLLTNAGVDPNGLELPDFEMQDLILSASADTDLNLALDIGGSIELFDTDVNLVLSLQIAEGVPTVLVGVGANDLRLDEIVPELAADELVGGFEFSSLALVVSLGGESMAREDLTPATQNFFDSIYGEDDYEVDLGTGVQFVANMMPFEGLADSMTQLGMDAPEGELRITGSLGVPWGDQTSFSVALRAELSGYTAPDHSQEWLRAADLAVEVKASIGTETSITLALVGDMTVKIIDGTLDEAGNLADAEVNFSVSAQFEVTPTGLRLQFSGGITGDPWVDPFGLEWLTINELVLGVALETTPPSLDVYFNADVEIAGKQMAGTIGLAINVNTGIPTNLVLELSSTSTWGTDDLVELYTLLDPVGGEWLGETVPVIQLRPYDEDTPLQFKFVLRDSPTADAGFALSGSLWAEVRKGGPIEQVANLDIDVSTAGIYLEGAVTTPIYLGVATLESADFDLDWTFVPPEFALMFAADIRSELFGFTTQIQGEIPFDIEAALGEALTALQDTEAIWAALKPLLEDDPLAALNGELIDDLYASQGLETPVWISELLFFIESLPNIEGIPLTPVQLVNDVLGGFDISVPPGNGYPVGGEEPDGCGLINPLKHTDGRCYTITPSAGNEAGFRTITECPIFQFLENGQCWTVPPSMTDSEPMQTVCPVGSTLEDGRCWVLGRSPDNLAYAERNKVYSCDLLWKLEGSKCSWYDIFGNRTDHVDAYYGCPAFSASFEGKCYTSPIPGAPTPSTNLSTGAEIKPTLGCPDVFQVADYSQERCWTVLGPPTLASNPTPIQRLECSYINSLGLPEPGMVADGKCYYFGQVPRLGTPVGGADQGCAFWAPFFVDGKCWTIPPTPELQIVKLPGLCTEFDIACSLTGLIEDTILSPIVEDLKEDLKLHKPDIANQAPTALLGFYTVPEGGSLTIEVTASDPEGGELTYAWDLDADGSYDDGTAKSVSFSAEGLDGPSIRNIAVRVTDEADETVTARGEVTIENVAPTLTIDGDTSVDAAATYTLELDSSDPGDELLTWLVDWGDGSAEEALVGNSGSLTHVYTGAVLNPTIRVEASDEDDDYVGPTLDLTVVQVDPEVTVEEPADVDEGDEVLLEGTLFEPGADDSLTLTIDWGDGTSSTSTAAAGVTEYSATHRYRDDDPSGTSSDSYTITVTATNTFGASDEATTSVTVRNVEPTLTLDASDGDEGTPLTLAGQLSDPGSRDTFEGTINWGDGSSDPLVLGAGATGFNASHVYADDGTYTVTVDIEDDDRGGVIETTTIEVANVTPRLVDASLDPAPSDEAELVSFTATLVEPGADVVRIEIDWGDGSSDSQTLQPGETAVLLEHTYLDDRAADEPDSYPVAIVVTDDDGAASEIEEDHGVRNVAPSSLALSLSDAAIDESTETTLSGTFDDPGTLDTFTVTIDWGDDTEDTVLELEAGERSFDATHLYSDDNPTGTPSDTFTISVTVEDDDRGTTNASTLVQVNDVAPSNVGLTLEATTIVEDGIANLAGTFDDPGTDDTFEVVIDWGDGSPTTKLSVAVGERSFVMSHQYLDDDPTGTSADTYTISVTVTDDDTLSANAAIDVVVENAAAEVSTEPEATILSTETHVVTASFTDLGTLDTHTATIDWGDGVVETIGVVQGAGSGSLSGSHRFVDPGTYTVVVSVTDDDGETGEATLTLTVLGPQDLLRQAIEVLEAHEQRSKNVRDGIDRIGGALNDRYWADVIRGTAQHGHSIFDRLEQGIRKLEQGLSKDGGKIGASGISSVEEALRLMGRAEWILISVTQVDAEGLMDTVDWRFTRQTQRELDSARAAFNAGISAEAAGDYGGASKSYGSAWRNMVNAFRHAGR